MNEAPVPTFEDLVNAYENTAAQNDALHARLTALTWADPVLAAHRAYIEQHRRGFGDPAFHAMWKLLLHAAGRRFPHVDALEIGVYKGQVLSLWGLLARTDSIPISLHAISPLAGQPMGSNPWLRRLRFRLDRHFREKVKNGNFYEDADYEGLVRSLFAEFGLDFSSVCLHRGFSNDPALLHGLGDARYQIIYVDGDHTYEGSLHDFKTFAHRVVPGGWLIADDAGTRLPGTSFWKGHDSVSRAVEILFSLGFKNVLNVGHNRIFERPD